MQHAGLLAIPVLLVLEAAVSVEQWAHETLALLRRACTRHPPPHPARSISAGASS
jgi:hypothetical protein